MSENEAEVEIRMRLKNIFYYIIPFALVRHIAKKFSGDYWKYNDRTYHVWQLDDGEFYLIDCQKELIQRKIKLETELNKIERRLENG